MTKLVPELRELEYSDRNRQLKLYLVRWPTEDLRVDKIVHALVGIRKDKLLIMANLELGFMRKQL